MSDSTASQDMNQQAELTAEQVVAYLKENPDFFKKNPNLIADLNFKHDTGGAVSLIQRQVELLREHHKTTRTRLAELSNFAKTNEALLSRIEKLAIATAGSKNHSDVLKRVEKVVIEEFLLSAVYLVIQEGDLIDDNPSLIQVSPEDLGGVRNAVYNLSTFVGKPTEKLKETILVGREDTTASIAMVRFKYKETDAYLIIGSRNPDHFRSDMGTHFIAFIGEYLQALLSR